MTKALPRKLSELVRQIYNVKITQLESISKSMVSAAITIDGKTTIAIEAIESSSSKIVSQMQGIRNGDRCKVTGHFRNRSLLTITDIEVFND